jgi:hypothetical protein
MGKNMTLNKPDADRFFYLRCIPSCLMTQGERNEEAALGNFLKGVDCVRFEKLCDRAREICGKRWRHQWKRP